MIYVLLLLSVARPLAWPLLKQEFVQTMRTELGTQGGFSMPEFYWRISREEMSRGKFYSRIDRLNWEDM